MDGLFQECRIQSAIDAFKKDQFKTKAALASDIPQTTAQSL